MIGKQDVFLTFPWFPRQDDCPHCKASGHQDLRVAVRFFALFFVPLAPKEILYIRKCRNCGGEVCTISDFAIHLILPLAAVSLAVAAGAITLLYFLRGAAPQPRTLVFSWGTLAVLGLVGLCYAVHKARRASRTRDDKRKPGDRSFVTDIENGFWVVMPFGFFLSLLLAFGGLRWVVRGPVPPIFEAVTWRLSVIGFILAYWYWKRHRIPILRVTAYAVVVAAVSTDLLLRLLGWNSFLVGLVCFAATLGLSIAGHYWSLALMRRGGRDAMKLGSLLEGVRSGERASTIRAIEMLGQMLDSPIVRGRLDEVTDALKGPHDPHVQSKYAHVPDLFETLSKLKRGETDPAVLQQRVCLGSRAITLVRPSYVCCRDEGPFGSRTRFITVTEIDPEPATQLVWGTRWLRASLAPLALLVISTLAMLLAGNIQPVSWVVFGGITIFCLAQGVMASGRKQLFYDRYHSQVLLGLFAARPNRGKVNEFVTRLSRAIRGEPVDKTDGGGDLDAQEPQPEQDRPSDIDNTGATEDQ